MVLPKKKTAMKIVNKWCTKAAELVLLKKKRKIFDPLLYCKVCKEHGYYAWFLGDTCWDCLKKPCLNCRLPGHTTKTCPAPHTIIRSVVGYAFERQIRPRTPRIKPPYMIPHQVSWVQNVDNMSPATCLEFHPTNNNILLSGNWDGELVAWDFCKVALPVVYGTNNGSDLRFRLNTIKFNPENDDIVYAASSDGTVSCINLETKHKSHLRLYHTLSQLLTARIDSVAMYGMDINADKHAVFVADDHGYLNMVDFRTNSPTMDPILIHREGSKVVGLHCNPVHPDLLLSCASDRFARIWDIRLLKDAPPMYDLAHNQTVYSAFFSPVSGSKILTTSKDNRLCIWDPLFGNQKSPSREIVHGHELGYLTFPRAEWDPKDPFEALAVIGRTISGNCTGPSLFIIDFIDTSTGELVAEVKNPSITATSSVIKLHPRNDVLATASLRIMTDEVFFNHVMYSAQLSFGSPSNQSRKRKVVGESDDSEDDN